MHNKINAIQGLRGLSVILVILFHLSPKIFSLGFLGVDIFFVISGFVITKSISSDIKKKRFTFSEFYAKRVSRLYPALLFFIFTSIILIFFLTIIDSNFNIYFRTAIYSLFGVSNFYLIRTGSDYFNMLDNNPFVHTWSLAVEEQFYLLYPILLFFILIYLYERKILFFSVLILIILISNFLIQEIDVITNFYSIFSRSWELLIGCLCFFLAESKKYKFKKLHYEYLIIFFIILLFFIENIKIQLLIISLVALLTIFNHEKKNFINFFLENRILLYLGKISYSLYLWHMVIFFIMSYYFIKLEYYIFSIILSIFVSNLSYNLIEKKFTKNKKLIGSLKKIFQSKQLKLRLIFIISIFVIIFTFNIDKIKKLEAFMLQILSKINLYQELQNSIKTEINKFDYLCHENISLFDTIKKNNECFINSNQENLLIFFGDSHNNSLKPFLNTVNFKADKVILSFNSSSFLHPILRNDDIKTIKLKKLINEMSENYSSINLILSFDHVFSKRLTDDKKKFQEKLTINYNDFLKDLSINKNIKIILLEDKPTATLTLNQCKILEKINFNFINDDKNSICNFSIKSQKDLRQIKNLLQNIQKYKNNFFYIQTNEYFCDNYQCNFYDKNLEPFFYDKKHLTYNSAKKYLKYVEKKLSEKIFLNN